MISASDDADKFIMRNIFLAQAILCAAWLCYNAKSDLAESNQILRDFKQDLQIVMLKIIAFYKLQLELL